MSSSTALHLSFETGSLVELLWLNWLGSQCLAPANAEVRDIDCGMQLLCGDSECRTPACATGTAPTEPSSQLLVCSLKVPPTRRIPVSKFNSGPPKGQHRSESSWYWTPCILSCAAGQWVAASAGRTELKPKEEAQGEVCADGTEGLSQRARLGRGGAICLSTEGLSSPLPSVQPGRYSLGF